MSFPYLSETEDLTDAIRSKADGSFIRLADGMCHYELSPLPSTGNDAKATVVLVHGFSVPCFIWDPTFDFLVRSGFRVLRYDLFGRGYSDRPRTNYGVELYLRQLCGLLDALDLRQPIHLAGLSMGGVVSVAFTERFPERVSKLILVDPAGAKPIARTPLLKLIQTPILGELTLGLGGDNFLLNSMAADFFDPDLIQHFIGRYKPQMKIKGFKRALLSTIRNNLLGDFSETYRRVGTLNTPTLLFWGRNDATVPFAHSALVTEFIPRAELHVIENTGHIPHYEAPGEVNPLLLEFILR
ncbi:MAG: 2-hydroxy-6-oxononadienedioate/2-hydroxy-6-oxononatrienedioate hydrolase [Anaerolineales bacterium]|nr:2-hydroxy-6-oxononadienedioate/2-hydroxy-6-oxononatrienedioate hydrolase [Anaerolineales bacterium]